jgi:cell wall-associated NlpC family hydrolase
VKTALVNPLLNVAGNDDFGGQAITKSYQTAQYTWNATKVTAKTAKATAKTAYKTGKNTIKAVKKTAEATAKTAKTTAKAAKATAKAAQAAAKATAATVKTTVAAIKATVALIASNPVTLIIAIVLIVVMIIIALASSMGGFFQASSYGGAGGDQATMSLNDYSNVYDYVNKAIAQKYLDLNNLQDSWTGFLSYNYKYSIEHSDGTIEETTDYPIVDVTPIMAYLHITHRTYSLTDSVKAEINNIINNLYTFDYQIEPYSYTVDHGGGNITTYTGEKVTFFVVYHDAATFFESSGYISSDRMAVYYAVKSYGDMSYFRLYNIFKDKNWHDWITAQYGYSIKATYNFHDSRYDYEMIEHNYCQLSYKNKSNETAPNIYSPLNGRVTSIQTTSEYDYVVTLKDDANNIEFIIMADFAEHFTPRIRQGDTVTVGQLIATRDYYINIKCRANGADVSPMLLMEYYQHN